MIIIINKLFYDTQISSLPILRPNFHLSRVQSAEVAFDLSQSDPGRITIIIMSSCIESIRINFFFGGGWANGKRKGMDQRSTSGGSSIGALAPLWKIRV